MAITVNHATLARQVDGEIQYIYPKTTAELVEYDSSQSVKDKIDSIAAGGNVNVENKVDKPLDNDGNAYNGTEGQVLETNGDGTTSWKSRARVYVGSGDMPDGYDVQIDPTATAIEIDRTLSIDGAVAEASAVGAAINNIKTTINELHAGAEAAATDLDELTEIVNNGVKDYILFKDVITGYIYIVRVEDGVLVCISRCVSIAITTMPTKTEYKVGEVFDPTGMVVTAICEDGKTRVLTKYTYDSNAIAEDTTSIQIAYIENGTTFVTNVAITINDSFDAET